MGEVGEVDDSVVVGGYVPTTLSRAKDSHGISSCHIVFPNQICAEPKALDEHGHHDELCHTGSKVPDEERS